MNSTLSISQPAFAVIGAGHGGTAMAGHLSLMGFDVSLYNRSSDRIRAIQESGGIEIIANSDNIPHGFTDLRIVTSSIAEAVKGRDVIMVVVPATGHRFIAEQISPYLEDNQII
ncbi:MAG: NAD(P)-binding domain-containing protein, partial [Clostridiaceae bacterium]|nr:NAD(P)-binding domain-containing protein [Clostridiaceae bacterium]